MVRNSDSGEVVAELEVPTVQSSDSGSVITETPSNELLCCCFSPNGNLVAGGAGNTIYIWGITNSNHYLIKTLIGHTRDISSLTFSSSLTSASYDGSVKFWQISTSPTGPAATDIIATPPTPTKIRSASLQTRAGVAITSDAAGGVKTWDLTTGLCKASFETPAQGTWRDAQLIEGRLIHVWWENGKIHIWDAEKKDLIQTIDISVSDIEVSDIKGLRISRDGSKVFCLTEEFILIWAIFTGGIIGKVKLEGGLYLDPLCADGSKIWVRGSSLLQGWDFGTSDPLPIPLSSTALNRPRLDLVDGHRWWAIRPNKVKDVVTGEEVFQLSGRYGEPYDVQWDGWYLVAGYQSGEVLILDFNHVIPQ